MVPQDVPQLQLATAAAEALPRTGGGAGLQLLVGRAQAGAGRLTEAVHRQVPQLRYARAERRRGTGGRRSCATVKTLRAHGFNQRPRFEQVVGYLEQNEPLPLDQPDRKATSFITSHFYLDDFVQSSEDPPPAPAAHASASNSRGRLPQSHRGHRRGRAPCAEVRRNALHHGPPAQHCRRRAGGSGPHRRRGRGARSRAGLPLSCPRTRRSTCA